jgi:predicted nuclease with RNAse H fold
MELLSQIQSLEHSIYSERKLKVLTVEAPFEAPFLHRFRNLDEQIHK